jgi:replicative DNA helicase
MEKDLKKLDLDFYEKIIIYNCLTDPHFLGSVVDYLKPELFRNKDIRSVISVVNKFYLERNVSPTITEIKAYLITDDLKSGFKKVVESFHDLDKTFNRDELIKNTEIFLKERSIYNILLDAAEKLDNKTLDTAKLLDNVEQAVSVNLTTERGIEVFEDIDVLVDELTKEEPTISTGWKWLDSKIGNGFQANGRSMYVFIGETNVGKSIFLGNIASNIALQNKTVLIISLEMPETMYAKRLVSSITKIPMSNLVTDVNTLKTLVRETKNKHSKAQILIKEFAPSTLTPAQLSGFIKKLIQTGIRPDAIVIDYINIMSSPVGSNSYEKIKYLAEKIRAMSYEFSCPIITASQINRSGYNTNEPGLETVSESMALPATSDCIFTIWQSDEDKELGVINLGIVKNRFGPNFGAQPLKIDYHTLTLSEDSTLSVTQEALEFSKSINDLVELNS